MFTFEYVLEDSTVLMTCPLKVHVQFINRFGPDNVLNFMNSIFADPRYFRSNTDKCNKIDNFKPVDSGFVEMAKTIFGLSDRIIGIHLSSCTELFDRLYLPNKKVFTIKERKDALAKLAKVRDIASSARYKQEVQNLINNHSSTYKLDLFVFRGTGPTNNDYVKLINALAQFYENYRAGCDPTIFMTTGLVLQKDYETAIEQYIDEYHMKHYGNR